jgi:hypothetical protein
MPSLARALMSAHHWDAAGDKGGAVASARMLDEATARIANGSRSLSIVALDIESSSTNPRIDR